MRANFPQMIWVLAVLGGALGLTLGGTAIAGTAPCLEAGFLLAQERDTPPGSNASFSADRSEAVRSLVEVSEDDGAQSTFPSLASLAALHVKYALFHEAHGLRQRVGAPCADSPWLLGASVIAVGDDAARMALQQMADQGNEAAALWLILGATTRSQKIKIRAFWEAAVRHVGQLPRALQPAARVHLAWAAMEDGEVKFARALMDQVSDQDLDARSLTGHMPLRALAGLIRGRLAELDGAIEEATDHYGKAAAAGGRPGIEAKLHFLNVQWQDQPERLAPTIRALEMMRAAWRGDAIEHRILLTLVRAYLIAERPLLAAIVARDLMARAQNDVWVEQGIDIVTEIVTKRLDWPPTELGEGLLRFEVLANHRRLFPQTQDQAEIIHALKRLSRLYHLPLDSVRASATGSRGVMALRLGLRDRKGAAASDPAAESAWQGTQAISDAWSQSPFLAALGNQGTVSLETDGLSEQDRTILALLEEDPSLEDLPDPSSDPFGSMRRVLEDSRDTQTLVQTYLASFLEPVQPERGEPSQ